MPLSERRPTVCEDDRRPHRGVNVLVAEDTPLGRKLMQARLLVLGCTAEFVENGQQAVEKALEGKYDVVFMDLMMPVMDGLEATAAIREAGKQDLPIIALTAAVRNEDREKCERAGFDDFLGKPIDPEQLEEKLAKWAGTTAPSAGEEVPGEPDGPMPLDKARTAAELDIPPELYDELLHNFHDDARDGLEQLDAAAGSRDSGRIAQVTHRLKGSAAMLRLDRVREITSDLESAGGTDRDWEVVHHRIGDLKDAVGQLRSLLA